MIRFLKAWIVHCYRDADYRNSSFLKINTCSVLILALFHIISGIIYESVYMGMLAAYYILLNIIRIILVTGIKSDSVSQWKRYRICAAIILISTLPLLIRNAELISGRFVIRYPWYLIYGVAGLTTYNVTMATISFFTERSRVTAVYLANKNINIIVAAISLFTLQSALLSEFGNDPDFTMLCGTLTGMAVFIIIIGVSAFMIRSSTKKIRSFKDTGQDNLS